MIDQKKNRRKYKSPSSKLYARIPKARLLILDLHCTCVMILRTSPPQILKFIRSTLCNSRSVIRPLLAHELVPTSTDLHVCSHAVAGDLSTIPHTLHSLRRPRIFLGDVRRHFCRDRRDIVVVVPIGNGAHLGGDRSDTGWSVECTTLDWEGLVNYPALYTGQESTNLPLWTGQLAHRPD